MNETCFICSNPVRQSDKDQYASQEHELASLVGDILETGVGAEQLLLCKNCISTCVEYDAVHTKLQALKAVIVAQYKASQIQKRDAVTWVLSSPVNTLTQSKVTPTKRVVLPASKLQPLPPNYVINVSNLASSLGNKLVVPKITTRTIQSSEGLKLSVGSVVPTQYITTTSTSKNGNLIQQALSLQSAPINLLSAANTITVTSAVKTVASELSPSSTVSTPTVMASISTRTTDALSLNMSTLPKDFLDSDDKSYMKKEMDEENNDELPMEIDEDCTLRITKDTDPIEKCDDKASESDGDDGKDSEYYEVSDGVFQVLAGDDEDDEQAIVMSGENGSILRVVAGQKLVYEQIAIVADQGDGDGDDDDDGDNDSNDESQIELQVSGDEETANAIIAAAQEQGGAFIKVESGEMFRVKSVQSKKQVALDESQEVIEKVGDNQYKCLLCEDNDENEPTEYTSTAAVEHARSVHAAAARVCAACGFVTARKLDLAEHMQTHATERGAGKSKQIVIDKRTVHECNVCNKRYNSRTLLAEHLNTHSGARPHRCLACGKAFASKYTYQAHVKTHLDRPRPFKCNQCPKSFLTQQNLTQHERTHLGIKDFKCNVCGKAFGTQHNLDVHGVVHSGERPFVCNQCGKGFARRAELKDHIRTHTGERPFQCPDCGARFAQRSNLHSHRRATHLADRRYGCPQQGCDKRFKRRRLLEYHIKAFHTGERPLQCGVCRATFVYPEHYKKHVRIHSGERPFVCEVCGKSFNSRDNRNTHRFVHSDKKPYECLVCGAGYMRKAPLYAHMNASGHLAESIVVNQPRVQKVAESVITTQPSTTIEFKTNKLDTIFETTQDMESNGSSDVKSITKSTISLVQPDDGTLLALPSIDTSALLQGLTVAPLTDQAQILASTEDGSVMKLVQIQLDNGGTGWVAVE